MKIDYEELNKFVFEKCHEVFDNFGGLCHIELRILETALLYTKIYLEDKQVEK